MASGTTYGSGARKTPPWMDIAAPEARSLRVYALDPSVGGYQDNRVTIRVPWEKLGPGPTGRNIAVVDYDAHNDRYYPPIDLEEPTLLARQGLEPSESDPRFHQQMVYAIATRTIQMFEVALGRDIHWRRAERDLGPDDHFDEGSPDAPWRKRGDIWVLNLYPHAMHEANAYYSPDAHGIVFGYFAADEVNPGRNLPGQRIFTCLSHDIIAHEVTHAIIDGIRTHFTEPTNPDVLAFHEGFADLCALFSHFSMRDTLLDAIRGTSGLLYTADLSAATEAPADGPQITAQMHELNPLIQLAIQFGQARGGTAGLRSAIANRPTADAIKTRVHDPHFRGSILVSAVFDAFFSVYVRKTADLFQIHRAGGGNRSDDLPEPLARRLADAASSTATTFFTLCARALDYCPPVDVTFGDFFRAMVTVARELDPRDLDGVRDCLMDAFRLRGIVPEGATFFSEDSLSWPRISRAAVPEIRSIEIHDPDTGEPITRGLQFGGPHGMTKREKDINGRVLRAWTGANCQALGLDPALTVSVPSFHSVFRVGEDGRTKVTMIVEVVQLATVPLDPDVPAGVTLPFRGGATLVIDGPQMIDTKTGPKAKPAEVRYVIAKPNTGPEGALRLQRQRNFAIAQGFAFDRSDMPYRANFAVVHGER